MESPPSFVARHGGKITNYYAISRSEREPQTDWNIIEGKWKELKGHAREQWGKLTDDELEEVGGKKDRLVGKLQQKYGYSVVGVVLGLYVHFDRGSQGLGCVWMAAEDGLRTEYQQLRVPRDVAGGSDRVLKLIPPHRGLPI